MTGITFNPIVLHVGLAENISCWNYRDVVGPFARMYYLPEGQPEGIARVVIGNVEYPLRPGYLYLIPPFVRHDELSAGPFTHYYLHLYDTSSPQSIFENYDFPFECRAGANEEAMFRRLLKALPGYQLREYEPEAYSGVDSVAGTIYASEKKSPASVFLTTGVVYCLMSGFVASGKPHVKIKDGQIRKSLSYLLEQLSDSSLSVSSLAQDACLSENQYIRRFRAQMGTTPLQYITSKRIEKAQVLLMDGDASSKSVSAAAGFSDSAYFCRVFKKIVGLTPLEFKLKFVK